MCWHPDVVMTPRILILLGVFLHFTEARDYCIVGAGPAGLQLAYFFERSGHDYIVYERDPTPGWFFKIYPRHRQLISINKRFTGKTNPEFNMRHDWNSLISDDPSLLFGKYTKDFFPHADVMVKYLKDYAEKLHLKVQYDSYITKVSSDGSGGYNLKDKNGNAYFCKYLVVSTGLWVENVPKNLSGLEFTEGYSTFSTNPEDYEGQSVLIIGKGNSAFETSQSLLGYANYVHLISRNRMRFSWETHYVGDLRAVNDGAIDTYQLKSLDGFLEVDISQIEFARKGDRIYILLKDNVLNSSLPDNFAVRDGYDRVLRCMGFKFDRSIFDKDIRPNVDEARKKYPEIKPNYESATQKNMFFAGTITHSLDWRKSSGGFIHGFRYTVRALHRLLMWRNHKIAWPSVTLPTTELLNHVLKRLNEADGTYQMFSALVDVVMLHANNTFEFFEEFPLDLISEFEEYTGRPFERCILINLEYGKDFSYPGSDPFREDRATGDAFDAHASNFLHPVLYYYRQPPKASGKLGSLPPPDRLHHMVEDFLTEWIAPMVHILPLRWFLEYCTGQDLRNFYAETCFEYAMTYSTLPLSCEKDFFHGMGLPRSEIKPVADDSKTTL